MRSAIQNRVNKQQQQMQQMQQQQQQMQQQQGGGVPQNRVLQPPTGFGMQQGVPQGVGFQPQQTQFQPGGATAFGNEPPKVPRNQNMTVQDSFNLVFQKLTSLDKGLQLVQQQQQETEPDGALQTFVDEFNSRTDILAGEINELKDMLLKLQSFTLEVNKKLFEQTQMYSDTCHIEDVETNE